MKKLIFILFLFAVNQSFSQGKIDATGNVIPTGSYPIVNSADVKGGLHKFQTIVERNAFPSNYKDSGMLGYVVDSSKYYTWTGSIWKEFSVDVTGKKDNSDSTNAITGYTTLYQNSLKVSTAVANATYATIANLNLKANDNAVFHLTGDESGTGTKTFNNSFQTNSSTISYWGSGLSYGFLSWNTGKAIVGGQSGNALSLYANGVEKLVIGTDGKARYYSDPLMANSDSLVLADKKYVDSIPLQKTLLTFTDRLIPFRDGVVFFGDDVHKWANIFTKNIKPDTISIANTLISGLVPFNSIPNLIFSDSNNNTITPVISITHSSYNSSTGIGSSILLRTSNNIYGSDFTGAEIQTSATNMSAINYDYRVKTTIGNVLAERFRISDNGNFLINQQVDTFYKKLYVNGTSLFNGKVYIPMGGLVSNNRDIHTIYTIGNSLTYSSGLSTYQHYLDSLLVFPWYITNNGIAGNTTAQILARFKGTVIDPGNAEYVIIEGGVNDIIQGSSAVTIQNNLQAMYNMAKANGIKVVSLNIFPFKGNVNWTSGKQATLDSVNNWIATFATNIDYKVDTYTKLQDPSNPGQLLPAYDDGSHLHLTVAGYDSVGAAIFESATFIPSPAVSALDIDGKIRYVTNQTFSTADSNMVVTKKYIDSKLGGKLDTSYKQTINLKYPIRYDSTTNTMYLAQSYLDSIYALIHANDTLPDYPNDSIAVVDGGLHRNSHYRTGNIMKIVVTVPAGYSLRYEKVFGDKKQLAIK